MSPRLEPLGPEEWGDEEYDAFGVLLGRPGDQVPRAGSGDPHDPLRFPVVGVLARHPDLAKGFLRYNNHLLFKGTLAPRLRELAILRMTLTRRSSYVYGEHVRIALDQGITAEEIDDVAAGNDDFDGDDRLVLEATDELLANGRLTDTWDRLVDALGMHPAIELIFVVGTYSTLAAALDTWEVPSPDGAAALPDP